MKLFKQSLYATSLFMCIFVASCSNDDVAEMQQTQESIKVVAAMGGNDSRTTYHEQEYNGMQILRTFWDAGDAIGLYSDTQNNLQYQTGASGGKGEFTAVSTSLTNSTGSIRAYYPYSAESAELHSIKVPNTIEQTYTPNKGANFYYAENTINNGVLELDFKPVFATLKITIPTYLAPTDNWTLFLTSTDNDTDYWNNACAWGNDATFNWDDKQIYGSYSTGLIYHIPNQPAGTKSLVCYIAILPQRAGNRIQIMSCEGNAIIATLVDKTTPTNGFEAGKVYSIDLCPNEYESTDYTQDGETFMIQNATEGKGINLVLMGEGFGDKDMETGGKYEQQMKVAADQLFALEPYKSFRDRFNIYGVKVVSKNTEFFPDAEHAFDQEKGEKGDNGIHTSDAKAFNYAETARTWASQNGKKWNSEQQRQMVAVVYNTTTSVGRSFCRTYIPGGAFVAYLMEGANEIILHEVGGHGIAQLLDEYVEYGYENATLPQGEINYLDYIWSFDWGWGANVDYRTDGYKWAHMTADPEYINEVSLCEGAFRYGLGAYRPTENSMMNANMMWFNAPSREAIYKAIMTMSEGSDWLKNYTLDNFKAIDKDKGKVTITRAVVSEAERDAWQKRHRKPEFVHANWRNALDSKFKVPFK